VGFYTQDDVRGREVLGKLKGSTCKKKAETQGVEELLAARGARLLRLSPYSPDFNPIEQCWSKIKTCLRRAKARTVEALLSAVEEALDTITQADIRGWFVHCGYSIQ
jgi:transposase